MGIHKLVRRRIYIGTGRCRQRHKGIKACKHHHIKGDLLCLIHIAQGRGPIFAETWSTHMGSHRYTAVRHDDVIKWKHFPRYWPFVRGIHRSPVNSPHKGQWRGAFIFSLICTWINGWVNNPEAGDLRRHRAHCDVSIMIPYAQQYILTTEWVKYGSSPSCQWKAAVKADLLCCAANTDKWQWHMRENVPILSNWHRFWLRHVYIQSDFVMM